jgi:hypothetical protein
MIKRVFFILIAINLFLPYVYAQDCESMMEAGDSYFSQKKYDKALAMYSQLQRKCGENYAGVIKKIEKCNSIITENSDYNKCTTIEGCDNYLNKYPNGRYVAKVRQKYDGLREERELARQIAIEDSIYNLCNSELGCENYLDRYPDGRYASEIWERKHYYEELRIEDEAYSKCSTMSGCTYYLNTYPEGRYYSRVSTKKEKMESRAAQSAYMNIRKIEFANGDKERNIIDSYGSVLYASDVKYLQPRISYDGIIDEYREAELQYKIIKPDGNLVTGSSSPSGYTGSSTFWVNPGKKNTVEMPGWGREEGGFYIAGVYKYELWYNDNRIYSTTITIKERENNLSRGEWRNALKKCSEYVSKSYDNGTYKGQLSEGRRSGLGMYAWSDGSYYIGGYNDSDRNGYGIYLCPDGVTLRNCSNCVYFVGNWRSNNKAGIGTCYDKLGNLIYYGKFENDAPTETYPAAGGYSNYKFECIKYSNGAYYVGETKNGKRHGKGILIWGNGDVWYGEWSNGSRDGYGIYMPYQGSVYTGTWKGDEMQ